MLNEHSYVLTGSRALNYWVPEFKLRENTDWDIVSATPLERHDDNYEFIDVKIVNNSELWKYCNEKNTVQYCGNTLYIPSLDCLAAMKRSHLWRDLAFAKHITMYHRYMLPNIDPAKIPSSFLEERTKLTHQQYPQRYPKLNTTVEDFFDDAVKKKYNHDFLHELVALPDVPMYTRMQKDKTKAWCEKQMWDEFTYDEKLKCVWEESSVIALERFIIPNPDHSYKLAYIKALDKVCTTLCSGWFRDFAIDNYNVLMQAYNPDKLQEVLDKLQSLT